jgi:hypothetical protein
MTALQVLFLLASVLSCKVLPVNPTVGIEVRRESDTYAFVFRNCFNPKNAVGIHGVTVTRLRQEGLDGELHCRISETQSSEPELTGRWTYGTTPAGYRMDRCEPLKPGHTYRAEVSGAGGGAAKFSIDNDGSVRALEGECK